jgi:hypothetical protein
MNTLEKNKQSSKTFITSKYAILNKVRQHVATLKESRCGRDFAINYDPGLITGIDALIEFAETVNLAPMPDTSIIDAIYGHLSLASAMSKSLPATPAFKAWLEKYGGMIAPEFIKDYKLMAAQDTFKPHSVEVAKFEGFVNAPPSAAYDVPPVDYDIIVALAKSELENPGHTIPFLSAYSETFDGVPTRVVTAQDVMAIAQANNKFNNYKLVDIEVDANNLYLSQMHIVKILGQDYDPDLVDMLTNTESILPSIDKDTSMGYSNIQFFDVVDGVAKEVPKPKKRDALFAQASNFEKYKCDMWDYICGTRDDIPFPGPLFEAHKLEIITYLEFFDQREEFMSQGDVEKAMMKQRLFYMSASLALMADNAVFKPLINTMRYWLSAIGIQVTNGGLMELWDMVMGERTSPLKQRWRTVRRFAKRKYGIDLGKRRYGEGDWSSYDTTLAAMVMAFAIATAFANFSADGDPLIRLLAITAHGQNITKVMYMYLADQYYRVHGRMFSGVLITSTIDTVYQIILYIYYLKKLMSKYADNELLREVATAMMFIMFFYGDDHVAGWCVWMEQFKLYEDSLDPLDDFVNMCVRQFGMMYKREASKRFDAEDVIGEIHFFTSDDGKPYEVEELTSWGMTFLKYSIVQTYIDGRPFLSPVPMKQAKDAIMKCGWSVSSSKNISLETAKIVALAYLNTNPEVHHQLKCAYDNMVRMGGNVTPELMEMVLAKPDSISLYLYSHIAGVTGDVDFPPLEENYRKQYKGYMSRKGFVPLDAYGNQKTTEEKVAMWRADDYEGSIIPPHFRR